MMRIDWRHYFQLVGIGVATMLALTAFIAVGVASTSLLGRIGIFVPAAVFVLLAPLILCVERNS